MKPFLSICFILLCLAFKAETQETYYTLQYGNSIIRIARIEWQIKDIALTYPTLSRTSLTNRKYVSLRKSICNSDNELCRWLATINTSTSQKRDLTVKLLDARNQPIKVWKIRQASPVKIDAPTLDGSANEVEIENIVLSYEGLVIE